MSKMCSICEFEKGLSEFPKTGTACKKCKAQKLREFRQTDPEAVAKRKKYREKNRDTINEQKRASYRRNSTQVKTANNQYYHNNTDKCRARQREYQERIETESMDSWLAKCFKHCKKSDKDCGREFSITLDYVIKLCERQESRCALTNIPMTHQRNDPFAASIDRRDSKLGHIPGNVHIVCRAANLAKRELSDAAIIEWFRAVAQHLPIVEFDGLNHEATADYPEIKKDAVRNCLLKNFEWAPPQYEHNELLQDWDNVLTESTENYICNDFCRSQKPSNKQYSGKRLIWHFQPHLWAVRTQKKPLMEEAWNNSKIRDRTATNLVDGRTRISQDRVIREFIFAGAGVPSIMHPGFAKAVLDEYGVKPGTTVFDPFAGWGSRMLATVALQAQYIAVDKSPPTVDGLQKMLGYLERDANVMCGDVFDCGIPDVDVLFTSPPFGTEEYIDSDAVIDLNKLVELTKHIKLRILHLNGAMLELLECDHKAVPILTKSKISSKNTHEYLVILD